MARTLQVVGKILSMILGIVFLMIGLAGILLPIFPGFVFILLGLSLLGIPITAKIKSLWKKRKG